MPRWARTDARRAGAGLGDVGESAAVTSTPGPAFAHAYSARVYYADTDFSGVVYYGRYLEFLERGRSDLLHAIGVRHRDLIDGRAEGRAGGEAGAEPLAWVIRRIAIDYRGSARIEDEIEVLTGVDEARGARLAMVQRVKLGDRTILDASVEAALITLDGRPRRLPAPWLERLSALPHTLS